ncbi:DUF7282 domain-containing protein [Halorussus marinus]|uniref:DUF7282 domain-containing protein n=1 Tax=Halorussus marinus TaxID=2505976 RepID=UPI00106E4E6B|nr:hypothetical protein [Halorussus marinus]
MSTTNSTFALAVACLLVGSAVALGAGIATAHGNHLSADAQLSSDGTVVVENLFFQNGGYLAVRADDGESPGRVLGYERLGAGYRSAVSVTADAEYWAEQTNATTVWATLHRDDGDGEFEPNGDDDLFRSFGSFAGTQISVGKTDDGRSYVVAASASGARQATDGPTVAIENASLAEPGYLAIHAVEDDYSPGDVVGHVRLEPGVHQNVTVEIDESFYESLDERYRLYAMIHADDGDGEFDPEADEAVTVGDATVGSLFDLRKAGEDGGLVNTAEPTATTTEESLVNTPTENQTTQS